MSASIDPTHIKSIGTYRAAQLTEFG